ncbi:MAG: hypothetical protein H6765_08485 [Candidatus Peribacteria bacterium]|nr:MAG: hypothetical protein H6765_08485 [Candidatus Peribacteria bacterium]
MEIVAHLLGDGWLCERESGSQFIDGKKLNIQKEAISFDDFSQLLCKCFVYQFGDFVESVDGSMMLSELDNLGHGV